MSQVGSSGSGVVFEAVVSGGHADGERLRRLRHLHICLFPVPYPPSFYRKVQSGEIEARLARDAEREDEYVGCVTWRLDDSRCACRQVPSAADEGLAAREGEGCAEQVRQKSPGAPVGCACGGRRAELLTLGVKVLRRRRGVGTELLRLAAAAAAASGAASLFLRVQEGPPGEEARSFYRSPGCGLAETGRRFDGYYPRLDPPGAVEMAAELRPTNS